MTKAEAFTASCHCGAVSVTIAHKPDYMNHCNCSLCAKSGGIWGYYDPAEVTVVFQAKVGTGFVTRKCDNKNSGEIGGYERVDYAEPAVRLCFCQTCGVTTHWVLTESYIEKEGIPNDRMGVNMRLFDDDAKEGVELRFPDGKGWDGKGDWGFWREAEVYGPRIP